MKKSFALLTIFLGLLLTFSLTACQEETNKTPTNEEITIQIDGMMCENACGAKIKKELSEIAGVEYVIVNFKGIDAANSVKVTYQSQSCNLADMKDKIENIGGGSLYQVKSMLH